MQQKTKPSLEDTLISHPLFEKINENRRFLPYAFGGLLLFILLLFKFTSYKETKNQSQYIIAEVTYDKLINRDPLTSFEEDLPLIHKLSRVLNSYPELQPRYDGPLAQFLLAYGELERALPFAKRTLNRTHSTLTPQFIKFSKQSLALVDERKSSINPQQTPNLYIASLLRNDEIANNQESLEALASYLQTPEGRTAEITSLLNQGSFSLIEFVKQRQKSL